MAGAARRYALRRGASALDVGCGDGDTLARLAEDLALECTGIDYSEAMVQRAKERHPQLDVRKGEADFLDGFDSRSFDLVIMECVLSLNKMPEEALHEAWCVLKPEGLLFVADLCERDNPSPFVALAEGIGFKQLEYEYLTEEIDAFAAEKIMEFGSLEKYFESVVPDGENVDSFCKAAPGSKPGYFFAAFRK
jgi:ubiquinone/menaquinone biosynthesis C-methylase UbiE